MWVALLCTKIKRAARSGKDTISRPLVIGLTARQHRGTRRYHEPTRWAAQEGRGGDDCSCGEGFCQGTRNQPRSIGRGRGGGHSRLGVRTRARVRLGEDFSHQDVNRASVIMILVRSPRGVYSGSTSGRLDSYTTPLRPLVDPTSATCYFV